MTTRCPHCNQPQPDREAVLWRLVGELRDYCDERGIHRGPGERISDGDAAKLLRKSPGTLGNWRTYQTGPRYSNIGRTIYYTLPDLAAFILGHE